MGGVSAIAAVAVIVLGILLAVLHQPSPIIDSPAVPAGVSSPADSNVTVAPPVPAFYDVDQPGPGDAGTMIKSERVEGGPDGFDVFRIVYNSRDNDDRLVPVSGLVVVPKGPPPAGGFPVVAYAHGTTGSNRHCGISLTPFEPNTAGFSNFGRQILPLAQEGWVVVGTDYLGMGAPGTPSYLVGKVEAQNVLDSIRAVHNWRPDVNRGLNAIWGHSQGGHSSAFAAELAPTYAPELQIQGAAVLAPGLLPALPFGVEAIINGSKPTGMTGFVMLIATSWAATYPQELSLSELLTDQALGNLPAIETKCGAGYSDPFMAAPMSAYVKQPVPAAFYELMDLNTPGESRIAPPIVMVQGMKDTTIIPQLTLGFQKQLCNNGTVVDFHVYPEEDHPGVVVASRPLINEWIKDRFAGASVPDNCPNKSIR